MSGTETTQAVEVSAEQEALLASQDQRAMLIRQADALGVKFQTNIGTDKLAERVNEAILALATQAQVQEPITQADATKAENARRLRLRQEASKLIRVQITCMDPMKKEYQGEIFTAGNSIVGSYRKFVLFNEPYHIENIILEQLRDKKCQVFITVKDEQGRKVRKGKLIDAYNIIELPPLTQEELDELASDQRARGAIA